MSKQPYQQLDNPSSGRLDTEEDEKKLFISASHEPVLLTWKNVSCTIRDSSGPPWRREHQDKEVLHDISGFAKPGTLTAIIGSSGAGKSTLLDILSGRKNIGKIDGDILMNGQPRGKSFKRFSAYVTQEDILMPTLTVEETLMFNVRLKLERDKAKQNREKTRDVRVDEMIEELGLQKVRQDRVGDENVRGISGGEKKRLCIGCEMIADPSLMFLDEPTTGLDAFNSQQVVYTLKKLARAGRTVICTLHQPRSSIFEMFDYLCCLSEGKTVYFGPASEAISYFETEVGQNCSQFYNPADFIIDLALEDEKRRFALLNRKELPPSYKVNPKLENKSLAILYDESHSAEHQKSHLDQILHDCKPIRTGIEDEGEEGEMVDEYGGFVVPEVSRFAVSWPYQFGYLMQRQAKHLSRTPQASVALLLQATFMGLFVGSLYRGTLDGGIGTVDVRVLNIQGALFFCMTFLAFGQMQALLQFTLERGLFLKEKAAGLYRVSAYYFAKTMSDVPALLVSPIIFCLVSYWFVGFRPEFQYFLKFLLIIFVFITTMSSIFVFFGCLTATPQIAQLLASLFTVIFLLFGGFYINTDTIPDYYTWLKYLSPFNYAFTALLQNEFDGNCICDDVEPPCPDVCDGTNYIFCSDSESDGATCLLGSDALGIWENLFILIGMAAFYRFAGYVCLRVVYNQRR